MCVVGDGSAVVAPLSATREPENFACTGNVGEVRGPVTGCFVYRFSIPSFCSVLFPSQESADGSFLPRIFLRCVNALPPC